MTNVYTRQQLIDALQTEYEQLIHDDFDDEQDFTLDEHLEYLKAMSYDELVVETSTDDDLEVLETFYFI